MITMTPQEIEQELRQYYCSENFYKVSPFSNLVMTDGVKALCTMCQSYWLTDIIASYQGKRLEAKTTGFQVWTLSKRLTDWLVTCDDGNGNIAVKQVISLSDFPLPSIKLYCTNGVILLPSEN